MNRLTRDSSRRKASIVIQWALPAAILVFLVSLSLYGIHFHDQEISDESGTWGAFGDFLGGVVNPFIGLITTWLLTHSLLHSTKSQDEMSSLLSNQMRSEDEARDFNTAVLLLEKLEPLINPEISAIDMSRAPEEVRNVRYLKRYIENKFKGVVNRAGVDGPDIHEFWGIKRTFIFSSEVKTEVFPRHRYARITWLEKEKEELIYWVDRADIYSYIKDEYTKYRVMHAAAVSAAELLLATWHDHGGYCPHLNPDTTRDLEAWIKHDVRKKNVRDQVQ